MHGLILAVVIMLVVSALLGWLGLHLGRRLPRRLAQGSIAVVLAGVVAYSIFLLDSLRMAQWLPIANVIVYGNMLVPLCALLIALAWYRLPGPTWQRLVLLVPLGLLAMERSYWPLFEPLPPLRPSERSNGIHRQTSMSSCSAAASASLLEHIGIHTDEREMAELCRTSVDGTSTLGIYRGLKIKTRGTAYDVAIYRGPAAGLRARGAEAWCVFNIGVVGALPYPLMPGPRHSLALLGFYPDGVADIADPFVARQRWKPADLDAEWPGWAICIVRRDTKR